MPGADKKEVQKYHGADEVLRERLWNDTLTGYEPNLTPGQFMAAWADNQNSFGAQAVMDRFHQSLYAQLHQRTQTFTIKEIYWQSNMFTGERKAETI